LGPGQGPLLENLDTGTGVSILAFLHTLAFPAFMILPWFVRPKRFDHWFEGDGGIGGSFVAVAGLGLIYLSCIGIMEFAYVSLVNRIWEALGGYVVNSWDIPSARSSGLRRWPLASSYKSGRSAGLLTALGISWAYIAALKPPKRS
jgi:hypothetical protein